jgi:hypothetical protein
MKYREFAEWVKRYAEHYGQRFTNPLDDWPMSVVSEHPGESPHAFELPPWVANSDEAKRLIGPCIAAASQLSRPTKLALITSAWMAPAGDHGLRPADHPERWEAVMALVIDAERSEGHIARITRTAIGPPTLGPWEEQTTEVSGRLADPLIQALR